MVNVNHKAFYKYANKCRKYTSKRAPLNIESKNEDDPQKMANILTQLCKSVSTTQKDISDASLKPPKNGNSLSFRNHKYRQRYKRNDRIHGHNVSSRTRWYHG